MATTAPFLTVLALLPLLSFDSCSGPEGHVALGMTARERVALTATASQIITGLPVEEGAAVTKGTVLVQLDDRLQRADVALARAQLQAAQANLDKLRAGARSEEIAAARADVDGAEAQLALAESTYARNTRLLASDTVAASRLDANRAERDSARASLAHAEATLQELQNGTRAEDLAQAQAEVAAAAAQLDAEERQLADLTVTASRDGWLDSLPWNLGERVASGSPVAVLLAADEMRVRVYVPEPARVQVHAGDTVEVRVDGIDTPYQGTFRWISSEPAFTPYYALNRTERARLMYLAEIALPETAADLPVGVPAQAILP